ncbi:serine/threonine protein kinase [Nocardiopsis exhalans]|uniref:Serine/threonine protein kinase n=1 Tax=Nocardiopsis exhalans TaxID=163604 RepID=A0ABY5DEM3_9ACTN|nr:serine/threonine-protein kinase [Nocardiopsis exhalans]USY22804.1 serine/threonine protein kinase [Nocardiopsis exhalans]
MSTSPDTVSPIPGLSPLEAGDPAEVGPYRLVGRIGAGGMGAVFGALDVYGRCVAVKTVHADIAREFRFREAFVREVEMLGRADGVSTARLHAADTEAEVPWLAFDYVPGRDLWAHVREFGPLSGDMLRTFSLGMAEGLAALHAAGIAHRDIKPGNVILSPDGPKIVDFGIAVEVGTENSDDPSSSYGTPGWTAPERYSGAVADPSADVFAWGGLVALAATGREPFGKGDAKELARRVKTGEHDVEGVPEDLRGLVEAALSVYPEQRLSSEELVGALLPGTEQNQWSDSLRRMLRDYWRGVDDAGHDPGRWAAALGAASATGLGVSALGSGALGSGAMGSGVLGSGGIAGTGAATGTVGPGMATAGGSTAVAGGGAAGTSMATGGMLSGVATSKLGLAGAGVLVVAGLAAGGFVVYDQVRVTPGETVAAAVGFLEEGQGFSAQVARSFSRTHAEQVAERTGTSVEQVMEDSRAEEEYLYSADTGSFLIRGAVMGPGTVAVANHRDELYVYAPRPEDISWGTWHDSIEPMTLDPSVTTDAVAPSLMTAPLRTLADSGQVEQEEGDDGAYSGPTTLGLLSEGVFTEAEAGGRLEVDEEGAPVRAEYTTEQWEVRVDFTGTDEGITVEDPQISAEGDGFGWAAVHAPVCGSVQTSERDWEVQASAWEVDCDYAMDVSEMMLNGSEGFGYGADQERVEVLSGYSGSGGTTWLVDEVMACAIFRRDLGGLIENRTYFLSPCQAAAKQEGELEEWPYVEVEFGSRTLIDYHDLT